jgi:cysteinyl-tRNA synthetase
MPIHVYNTLGRKKEVFEPNEPGKVRMYVCGPTVYDSSHIGHARSVVVFDVIARYLRSKGFEVIYVRNFTDIDDKIINRANELGIGVKELSEKYINEFHQDMDALQVERAGFEPKATEHISGIIKVIEILLEKRHAYCIDGDVFFSVETAEDYGKLSGRKPEDMEAGVRVDVDKRKKNASDFALWKSAKPGEPFWESPWGKGRPGWHIECSAMSRQFLGDHIDIHGGGEDLIFPHHENEIAQSESAFGKPFVKYWLHNGFININQQKMSKSLGNFLMIKDILNSYHPEALRLFLLSKQYRSPIDFTEQAMEESSGNLDKIYELFHRAERSLKEIGESTPLPSGGGWDRFCDAMDNDFNTAQGIGILLDEVRKANRLMDEWEKTTLAEDLAASICITEGIRRICGVLGILTQKPEAYFSLRRSKILNEQKINSTAIEALIQERSEARKARNWKKADDIRAILEKMNVSLEDRPEGTRWKIHS